MKLSESIECQKVLNFQLLLDSTEKEHAFKLEYLEVEKKPEQVKKNDQSEGNLTKQRTNHYHKDERPQLSEKNVQTKLGLHLKNEKIHTLIKQKKKITHPKHPLKLPI